MSDEKPMFPNMKSTKDLQRDTWNEAIEAAAKIADKIDGIAATDIRKLKR